MSRFVAVFLLLVGVAASARCEDDPKKAIESLQGEWKLVAFNKGGEPEPKDELEGAKVVVAGEKMTITYLKKDSPATFTVDPKAKPPAIDISPVEKAQKEKTIKGIYKIEKDTLTIAFGADAKARPTEFKASKDVSLMVLERVKK